MNIILICFNNYKFICYTCVYHINNYEHSRVLRSKKVEDALEVAMRFTVRIEPIIGDIVRLPREVRDDS